MMTNGTEVWVAFAAASGHAGRPVATVEHGVILDSEHMLVKRDSGYVGVIQPYGVETVHYTEAAAWRYCGDKLAGCAHAIEEEAAKCMRRAGSLASAEVVSV